MVVSQPYQRFCSIYYNSSMAGPSKSILIATWDQISRKETNRRRFNNNTEEHDTHGPNRIVTYCSIQAICSVSLASRLLLSEYWCYENAEHTSEILGAS